MSDTGTMLDYITELETQLQRYKEAAAQAGKDHGFNFDDYLAAHPASSLRRDAMFVVFAELGQTIKTAWRALEDLQKQEKELQDGTQKR